MRSVFLALLLSLQVSAQPSDAHDTGQIESNAEVADPVFRVHVKALGLERSVEMLQWRKAGQPAPLHYEMAWTAERIDSSGFDAAHRNGHDFPFNGERWWSTGPVIDGHPVSPQLLGTLDAWRPLKPDTSQLPTNLAVSFQPDGDWLSTSQDPAHPQVGDLRVRWRTIQDAPAPAGLKLVSGLWVLPAKTAAPAVAVVAPSAHPSMPAPSPPDTQSPRDWLAQGSDKGTTWLIAGGVGICALLIGWMWGRRARPGSKSGKRKPRKK